MIDKLPKLNNIKRINNNINNNNNNNNKQQQQQQQTDLCRFAITAISAAAIMADCEDEDPVLTVIESMGCNVKKLGQGGMGMAFRLTAHDGSYRVIKAPYFLFCIFLFFYLFFVGTYFSFFALLTSFRPTL